METSDAFGGLECLECGEHVTAERSTTRCPSCEGPLDPVYDLGEIDVDDGVLEGDSTAGVWRFHDVLPFQPDAAVSIAEGATPLVSAPTLADEFGVDRVLIKDESRNPTGSVHDRGSSVAVTAALRTGAETVTLPSTGNGGQSVSAYAGMAGLESEVYVPSRAGFTTKAMINVHGGEMNVIEGRMDDAIAAFRDDLDRSAGKHSLRAFDTPYRHEGMKTLFYEIAADLDWTSPDAIVTATGTGLALTGMAKAVEEGRSLGIVEERPRLFGAQAEGCAPIARAFDEGRDAHEPWQRPDTICGEIEIPDPPAIGPVLDALRTTDGGAIATDDETILEAGVDVAQSVGVEFSPSAAAAVSGAARLAERGEFDGRDTVVIVNTAAGNKESDVLRSHLMRKGI
ncbi:MAG: threonine synthase [Halanaeroarchaeum sp.]